VRRALLAIACVAVLGVPGAAQERSFGRATSIAMPRGHRLEAVLAGDADGDGLPDLWLQVSRKGKRGGRAVLLHRRRPGDIAFAPNADETVELHPDGVALAIADVHSDPGDEIVLLTRTGVFAVRRAQSGRDRFVRLVRTEVLWQLPHPRELTDWSSGVLDVDGDGHDDLLIPGPDGYVIAIQRRDDAGVRFESHPLVLPEEGSALVGRATRALKGRARGRRLQIQMRGDAAGTAELLAVSENVPAPAFHDWDGDGDIDAIVQTASQLLVWRQTPGGRFGASPDVRLELPIEVDRRRLLDLSYAALTADLDGDRRSDYLLVAGDRTSDEPRAQIALFSRQDGTDESLFGEKGRPQQLLIVAGLAADPRFDDVDGDGRPDLVIGAARLDVLDAITTAGGGSIDAELYVYRNENGRLSRQPALTVPVSVPAKILKQTRRSVRARFVGDLTGDRVSELMLRDDPERLRILMVRRAGEGLSLVERPLFETRVPEKADLRFLDGPVRTEIAVFDDRTLLHLRFGE